MSLPFERPVLHNENPKVVSEATGVSVVPPTHQPLGYTHEHILMPQLVVYSGQQRCCDDPTRLRPTWSRTSNRLRINPSAVCSDESAPYTWARHIGHNTIEGDSSFFRGCPSDFLSSIDGRALCVFLSIVIKIYILNHSSPVRFVIRRTCTTMYRGKKHPQWFVAVTGMIK